MSTDYLSYIKDWDTTLLHGTTLLVEDLFCAISYCKIVCPIAHNIQGITYTNLNSKGIYIMTAVYETNTLLHFSFKLGNKEEIFVTNRNDFLIMLMVELELDYEEALAHLDNVIHYSDTLF